jgi:hypothetical protein
MDEKNQEKLFPSLSAVVQGALAAGPLTHYPEAPLETAVAVDTTQAEHLLSQWFEGSVVLLGSGRAGLCLVMKALQFSRYRSRIQVPCFLSTCILDALGRYAFPVNGSEAGDLRLLYHQYGLTQKLAKKSPIPVLEDICHQFFASPNSGARRWAGEAAVFSLPKFFGIAGMGGGIVVLDAALADDIRALRDEAEQELPGARRWMREIISATYRNPSKSSLEPLLESAYALLLRYPRADAKDFAGFCESLDEIRHIGQKRSHIVEHLIDISGPKAVPSDILEIIRKTPPFAFPYFGLNGRDELEALDSALNEAGIHAGVYNIDIARDMEAPIYKPCLLLPCHQDVSENQLATMGRILGQSF